MSASVLAITNQKGGVGKTTTAINLAAALGLVPLRCLVVDLDPQGSATVGLGLHAEGQGGTYRMAVGGTDPLEAISKTNEPSVDLTSACGGLDRLASEGEAEGSLALRRCLKKLSRAYDYIFLDCPPSQGRLTRIGLASCDRILVPTQCEPYALEGIARLLEMVKDVQDNLHPALEVMGALLTMFEPNQAFAWGMAERIRERFGMRVWDVVIPRDHIVSKAASVGRSVVHTDPCSRAGLSFIELAREVRDHG